jgi:hypothetical protein
MTKSICPRSSLSNRPRRPRGILDAFFNLGARCGLVFNATPRPFYTRERPGTHCTGGWVSPRADPDGCGKSRPHRDSIAGLSSPWRVAVPTGLSRPHLSKNVNKVLLGLLDLEFEGITVPRNVGSYCPNDTKSHPRGPEQSGI